MNDLSEVIETQALVFMLQWSHHYSSQAPPTFPQPTEGIKQLIYIYSWQRGLVLWIKANTLGWWSGDKREAAAHSPFKFNFSHVYKNWAYLDTSLKAAIRSAKSYITSTVSASQGTQKGFRQSWVFKVKSDPEHRGFVMHFCTLSTCSAFTMEFPLGRTIKNSNILLRTSKQRWLQQFMWTSVTLSWLNK